MTRLNSRATFINKRAFPVVWFGGILLFTAIAISIVVVEQTVASLVFCLAFLPFGAIFAGFGYVVMRWLILGLADEVWDDGDALVVRDRGREERIPLAEIANVDYAGYCNPPRVTLHLRRPSALGGKVAFIPRLRLLPFRMPLEIRELMARVDAAGQR